MAIGYDGQDREWEDFLEDIAIPRAVVEEDEDEGEVIQGEPRAEEEDD